MPSGLFDMKPKKFVASLVTKVHAYPIDLSQDKSRPFLITSTTQLKALSHLLLRHLFSY